MAKVTMTIPASLIAEKRDAALESLGRDIKIDGFRPGHIPSDVLVARIGTMPLWTEQLEMVVPGCYIESITDLKLRVVGRPMMSVVSLVPDQDAVVAAVVTLMPEVTLPDYVAIAREVAKEPAETEVSEKDIAEAELMLRRMRAQEAKIKLNGPENAPKLSDISDEDLPIVDDEFVQALSPEFKTVADFHEKLRHNLAHEKEHRAMDFRRGMLMEKISEAASVDIPDMLVEYELDRMFAQFEYDINQSGINAEEYFEKMGKTRDEVRAEMQPDAYKRAKTQLVIDAIAQAEKIEPDNARVEGELTEMKKHYENVPGWNVDNARVYLETIISNQMTIERLEELGGFEKHNC